MSLILPTPLSKTGASVSSDRVPRTRFKFSYRRILLAYVAATAAILGGFALTTYSPIDYTLKEQLDDRLFTKAQAAIPSLEIVKSQARRDLKELPWRKLFASKTQSWEWFDANGKLLLSQGTRFPSFPLSRKLLHSHWQPITPIFQQQGELRVVTVSVYISNAKQKTLQLEGYIRVSESTQPLKIILARLWLYLGCQGTAILFLIGISGVHLSQWSSQPMQQSLRQLKQTVTNISHHLRHPLTRITLAIALLAGEAESATEKGGSISLTVHKFRCKAIVSVEDTGVGIPPEHHASIFQWFWRSEQAQQQQKGLGLGLAIAQAIAKQHGGEITVKSQANVGSCFQVTLPLF